MPSSKHSRLVIRPVKHVKLRVVSTKGGLSANVSFLS